MVTQLFFLSEVLVAAFVLWLGLYTITRDMPWRHETQRLWQRPPLLAGFGLLLASLYLYGSAMKTVSSQPPEYLRWQQLTLWGIPIAIVCFFWAVVLLARRGRGYPRWSNVALPVTVGIALFLAVGIVSGYVMDATSVLPSTTLYQPFSITFRQPFEHLYYGFILAGIVGCIAVLLNRLPKAAGDADRRQKIILGIAGGVFLLIGALMVFILANLGSPHLPKQIGDFTAAVGAALIGYDIAYHNALSHQQIIGSDFWHSFISVTITVLLCLLVYLALSAIFAYPVQSLAIVLISIFIVLTHTPYNWSGGVLDRLLLPRWMVGYRDKLLLLRQQPLTMGDPSASLALAEETFDALLQATRTQELEELIRSEIEQIFKYTNFNNAELLSDSRLFELRITQESLAKYAECRGLSTDSLSEYQRADCLRSMLRSAINDWSWSQDTSSRRARMERIILSKKYLERRSRVEVELTLTDQFDEVITGGGYSRRLKDAREHLARVLHERELAYNTNT